MVSCSFGLGLSRFNVRPLVSQRCGLLPWWICEVRANPVVAASNFTWQFPISNWTDTVSVLSWCQILVAVSTKNTTRRTSINSTYQWYTTLKKGINPYVPRLVLKLALGLCAKNRRGFKISTTLKFCFGQNSFFWSFPGSDHCDWRLESNVKVRLIDQKRW